MQRARGFIIGCANRVTLISWEAEHTEHQIGQAFIDKNHIVGILHTGYKAIGYNIIYTIQARWVIRGTQMFVLTCFWKNYNFAISTESSVVCAVNGKSTLLQSHAITLPYFASFTRGEVGGGWDFVGLFQQTPLQRLLDTHGKTWVSLLWGHCSCLLGPGEHKVLLCPPGVYFPVLCKYWKLQGGVNGDLLQEGLCHTQVCCSQSPCPCASSLLTPICTGDTRT